MTATDPSYSSQESDRAALIYRASRYNGIFTTRGWIAPYPKTRHTPMIEVQGDQETSMTTSLRARKGLTTAILVALFGLLFAGTANAERWYVLSTGTFDARSAFDLDSIGPVPGYPSAVAVLVYVHHGISTFSCAPPGDCIATSQLTYYHVDCGSMLAAEVRRIPMNLRDKVVATIDSPFPAWFSLVGRHGNSDRDAEDSQVERRELEVRHRELRWFCGLHNAGKVHELLNANAQLR